MSIEKHLNTPESEKWWKKNSPIPDELNDVPMISNKTKNVKNSDFIKLQKDIDTLVYEFIKKHDIPCGFNLSYSIDDLQSLKEYGIECPSCDGSLVIFDIEHNTVLHSQ